VGDGGDSDGPAIAPTTPSSDSSSDCAQAFVGFLVVNLALALVFVTATLALCHLPALCAGVPDCMAVTPVLVSPTRDLARRRLWRTTRPDDVPESGVASSCTSDIDVTGFVAVVIWLVRHM